jgi:hypothetical protein
MQDGKWIDPDELDYWLGDTGSGGGNCPAVLRAPGGYIVQGKGLSADTLAGVREVTAAHDKGTGPDETAVWIPENIIEQIRSGGLG